MIPGNLEENWFAFRIYVHAKDTLKTTASSSIQIAIFLYQAKFLCIFPELLLWLSVYI